MSLAPLSRLAEHAPLRILLADAGGSLSIGVSGLLQPLTLAAQLLGDARLQVEMVPAGRLLQGEPLPPAQIGLLVAGEGTAAPPERTLAMMAARLGSSECWGAVGPPVLWLARAGAFEGMRIALPWASYAEADETAERAILAATLFELDDNRLTCCGGMASIDLALNLIETLYGAELQARIREALCIDRVRAGSERQRVALQARFGGLQPKLSEAVALMEANIEEPLATDDIAGLVGISRRQLERLFKQYLNSVPSRYYLELRLQRARQLLLESSHSIVQVGLLCGFSSGSHFSTSYGTLFGITPREERQRKLAATVPPLAPDR